jgi:hypothetical protein
MSDPNVPTTKICSRKKLICNTLVLWSMCVEKHNSMCELKANAPIIFGHKLSVVSFKETHILTPEIVSVNDA